MASNGRADNRMKGGGWERVLKPINPPMGGWEKPITPIKPPKTGPKARHPDLLPALRLR